jgi:V/A-type H+-transporting ATPase subunit I
VTSGRENRNWAIRIALGAYNLYGVTGWLSDVLSYSRLLALGLATGVIASVVNTMGSMLGGGVGGAIFFIVVFLIGHTMNMAINLLGAYVHTNRLQFVEFFGKFYDAGGKTFEPFTTNTKYIEVKEEAKV